MYCIICFLKALMLYWHKSGSTLGRETVAPKPRPCLQCEINHCLTNSKHRHIGAKKSVVWPSKYAKMRFQTGSLLVPRWGAHDAPQSHSRLGRDTPPILHSTRCLDSPTFGTSIWLGRGIPPNISLDPRVSDCRLVTIHETGQCLWIN